MKYYTNDEGQVAVVHSRGYGEGFLWHWLDPDASNPLTSDVRRAMFCPELVKWVLRRPAEMTRFCGGTDYPPQVATWLDEGLSILEREQFFPDGSFAQRYAYAILRSLVVTFVPPNEPFIIREYDGSESVELLSSLKVFEASEQVLEEKLKSWSYETQVQILKTETLRNKLLMLQQVEAGHLPFYRMHGEDFSNTDWSGLVISGAHFNKCNFSGCKFESSSLAFCVFHNCQFQRIELANLSWRMRHCWLTGCHIQVNASDHGEIVWDQVSMGRGTLDIAGAQPVLLRNCQFSNVNCSGPNPSALEQVLAQSHWDTTALGTP